MMAIEAVAEAAIASKTRIPGLLQSQLRIKATKY